MKRISICMATYNGEKYVERQLSSIIAQLEANDEIVISDDNSTDETISIIRRINDKRIKIYTNSNQQGPVKNFENAIMKAIGDIILLADQDDIWYNNKLEVMRKLLEKNDLVLSDCIVIDNNNCIIHKSFFRYRNSKKGFWRNIYKNSYVGCCMGFRKETLSYIMPFPTSIHMHDWWIGLSVELRGKVHYHAEPLIYYVRHGGNASPTGEGNYGLRLQIQNRLLMLYSIAARLIDFS